MVNGARSKVNDAHGESLSLERRQLFDRRAAQLDAVDDRIGFRTAKFEDEVTRVEGRYFFLEGASRRRRENKTQIISLPNACDESTTLAKT